MEPMPEHGAIFRSLARSSNKWAVQGTAVYAAILGQSTNIRLGCRLKIRKASIHISLCIDIRYNVPRDTAVRVSNNWIDNVGSSYY